MLQRTSRHNIEHLDNTNVRGSGVRVEQKARMKVMCPSGDIPRRIHGGRRGREERGKREGGDEDAVYAEHHTENARRWREYTPCAGARSKCGVIAAATWSGAPVSFNHVD